MGIFQRMKQAREMRKQKLEEHKAKKRGELLQQQNDEQSEQSQPSPTNSVDEQNAPEEMMESTPPVEPEAPMGVEAVVEEPMAAAAASPSAGLLCGCL